MSIYPTPKGSQWNFRISATREVLVKAKNDQLRKVMAMDTLTGLPVAVMVSEDVSVEAIEVKKKYEATISVYTLKDTRGVAKEYLEFFEVLDADQRDRGFRQSILDVPRQKNV